MPQKTITPDRYARDAESWLTRGDIIYRASRHLFDEGNTDPSLYFVAVTLAHDSLEVLLKGILIREGMVSFDPMLVKRLPRDSEIKKEDCVWGHSLMELAEELATRRPDFDFAAQMDFKSILLPAPVTVRNALQYFEPFFAELRYPRALEQVGGFGGGDEMMLDELVDRLKALTGP